MPMIRIEYDNEKVEKQNILNLSQAIQEIVSRVTGIEDVFVYTNSSEIKVKIAPIEIFVEMTAKKIDDENLLIRKLKSELSSRKEKSLFKFPINLTLIPMQRKVEIGI